MENNMNMMHDLYDMAEENVGSIAPAADNATFPIKVVNAFRPSNSVIVDVIPQNTVESVIQALLDANRDAKKLDPNDNSLDLGLGDIPISELNVSVNGRVAKPSMSMKALGLHADMAEMPTLMLDPSGSNG